MKPCCKALTSGEHTINTTVMCTCGRIWRLGNNKIWHPPVNALAAADTEQVVEAAVVAWQRLRVAEAEMLAAFGWVAVGDEWRAPPGWYVDARSHYLHSQAHAINSVKYQMAHRQRELRDTIAAVKKVLE